MTDLQSPANRGTGAGGSNTNVSGLYYEEQKSLDDKFQVIACKGSHKIVEFTEPLLKGVPFISGTKNQFCKYLLPDENTSICRLHGTKEPDNWFIRNKHVYIIEMKFQRGGGSVCEKLQTARSKIRNFTRRYPSKRIHYLYVLSDWFKTSCVGELSDLREDGIPYFWGGDPEYKKNVIDYIMNTYNE
jgi:hypothetical protein